MKKIGILGGMSWESTALYYRWLNEDVRAKLGGLHSAKLIVSSFDFADIAALQKSGAWDYAGEVLAREAQALERAGVDCILIATNTMHKVADKVQQAVTVPLLHIADATAERILEFNLTAVGLLGTQFTMEQEFYKKRLEDRGIKVIIPDETDRHIIHQIIYDELCKGQVNEHSREEYRRIMKNMVDTQGAQGIILGCTEITILVNEKDTSVPVFDTTRIHVEKAVSFTLS